MAIHSGIDKARSIPERGEYECNKDTRFDGGGQADCIISTCTWMIGRLSVSSVFGFFALSLCSSYLLLDPIQSQCYAPATCAGGMVLVWLHLFVLLQLCPANLPQGGYSNGSAAQTVSS